MEETPKLYRAIMVSSTFTDLEEHRAQAIEAISRFGFYPNVMEYSGARSEADVIDTSIRMVRESFAYLCVIGHKYGQTPVDADRNPKGLSITELEFNEARRLGRPILLFLMTEDHPVTKMDVESDPQKQKKLETFRKQAKHVDSGATAERVYETFASKEGFAKKVATAVGLEAVRAVGKSNIPDRAIRDAVARFIDVRPEADQAELAAAIHRFEAGYRELERQVAAIASIDNRVTALKADAEAALADGDLDKARTAYREAADAARDKAAEPVRTAAELKVAEAGAHLLALDWQAADAAWTEATSMLQPFDEQLARKIMENAAERLQSHAQAFARAGALGAATIHLRQLVCALQAPGDRRELARIHNNIGNVQALQGEWIGGPEGLDLLTEGIEALYQALEVVSRDDPAWSMIQSNLGDALRVKGELVGGAVGADLLSQAVDAFNSALSGCGLHSSPFDWAMLQNNLGIALIAKSGVAKGVDEKKAVDEAIGAFRLSLSVSCATVPSHEWARMQVNLGNALQTRSLLEPASRGLHFLAEATANYQDAFETYTAADFPSGQAWVQNCLGSALLLHGRHADGVSKRQFLTKAAQAFLKALELYTPTESPLDWAAAQFNLGLAHKAIASVAADQDLVHLAGAEKAFRTALEVYTRNGMVSKVEEINTLLGTVRAKLASAEA
ncbi:MAG TPA: DUF4062 domain-containing protein [Allosphingosinicella sp.]|jgi:tetratricopeptide (TPR) repeat protein